MAYLTNAWVGYLTRSAEQIMNSLLNRLGAKVPEMTDHSPSNPYVRNLEQFAGIHEELGYYIDNVGRETFVVKARLYKSLIYKAREKDYQVIGNLPYSADIQFQLDQPAPSLVTFPAGTVLSSADGAIKYRTISAATIAMGDSVSTIVSAIQSETVTGVTVGDSIGALNSEIVFTDKIVHNSIKAYWDAVAWASKETLAYSGLTDTDYVQTVDENGNVIIYFGNALPYGKVPVSGETLTVDYDLTLGADGYLGAGQLNTIVTSMSGIVPVGRVATVANITNASGGDNVEDIESVRRHIPLANRTIKRAVTLPDFEDLTELAPGVLSAGAVDDRRRTISIYIVPVGGGIASTLLLSQTQTYIDFRKVRGTNPVIKAAGIVGIVLDVLVNAKPNYANADVHATVLAILLEALGYNNQKVKGTVFLSDLYEAIEGGAGVDNSDINIFAFKPYARPMNGTTPPLVWIVAPESGATATQRWTLQFTNSTTFRLIKGSTLIGTFSTGATVTQPEVQFVIPAGAYSNGNTYEFYTYPYNANSVKIVEPSMPILGISDIVINVIGGY